VNEIAAAIVLAAGAGSRLGTPKALMREDGRTWLDLAVERLAAAGFGWIGLVLGAEGEEAERRARACMLPATVTLSLVYNPAWPEGRTGSLQAGLRALPERISGVLMHQVDFARVLTSTFAALRLAAEAENDAEGRVLVPVEGGRRGHPIFIGRAVWPEIHALGKDEPLSLVVRREPGRVREVPVEDPGIHLNLNTRESGSADPARRIQP
jgi:molybdenum cofactor cytidylyltransferase